MQRAGTILQAAAEVVHDGLVVRSRVALVYKRLMQRSVHRYGRAVRIGVDLASLARRLSDVQFSREQVAQVFVDMWWCQERFGVIDRILVRSADEVAEVLGSGNQLRKLLERKVILVVLVVARAEDTATITSRTGSLGLHRCQRSAQSLVLRRNRCGGCSRHDLQDGQEN